MFVHLLINEQIASPINFWEQFADSLTLGFTLRNNNASDLGANLGLNDVGSLLEEYGKTLESFGLPQVTFHQLEATHELQRWAPHQETLAVRAQTAFESFNNGQLAIFHEIMDAVIA